MKKTGDCEGDPRFRLYTETENEDRIVSACGSYETILAAFQAGADAVYTENAGARHMPEILQRKSCSRPLIMHICIGKKLYLTVNTLIKEEEMKEETAPVSAALLSSGTGCGDCPGSGSDGRDTGRLPDILHVSTQAAVTGPRERIFWKNLAPPGLCQARELSLEEIRRIREETDLEIETFVHGALCWVLPGQCLFSGASSEENGNRGRCAQPCRLPYRSLSERKEAVCSRTGISLKPEGYLYGRSAAGDSRSRRYIP